MAGWGVIESTGVTLVAILQRHIDPVISGVDVRLATTAAFDALSTASQATVTVLLYQIGPNAELRNAPQPVDAAGRRVRQPLPLELCYMVTAWGARTAATPEQDLSATPEEQRLMGLVLRAFYDNAEIGAGDLVGGPAVWAPSDQLQISLDSLPVEDHYRIWDASELGYRLSVTYRVRVVGLDSAVTRQGPPVVDGDFGAARA